MNFDEIKLKIIIFSDEKKLNPDRPDSLRPYWHDLRSTEKIFSRRQAGRGGCMIWTAIGFTLRLHWFFLITSSTPKSTPKFWVSTLVRFYIQRQYFSWKCHVLTFPKVLKLGFLRIVFSCWKGHQSVHTWILLKIDGDISHVFFYVNGRQFENKNQLMTALSYCWDSIPIPFWRIHSKSLQKFSKAMFGSHSNTG